MQTRDKKPSTTKRMIVMVLAVLALIAIIAGIKAMLVMKMMSGMKPPPPAVVSTAKTAYQEWQPDLRAVGTLRAVRGADLALDTAGLVTHVNLQSGDEVKEGQLLLQLRDSEDVAQLHQLEAAAALAKVMFDRFKAQLAMQAVAKADYDQKAADLKAKQAAVAQQQVMIEKKQQLDPVYVDFHLPQKNLAELRVGQKVVLTLDAFPGKTFEGTLSAVSPKVDDATRNVQVEAKVANPDRVLAPGMFANVNVDVGSKQRYLTLPQTAVVYIPYGETVFVVRKKSEADKMQAAEAAKNGTAKPAVEKDKSAVAGKGPELPPDALVVQQAFVTTGATRGDQVAVVKGLDEGSEVVTSGQIKLKSGSPITIDNKVQPADSPNPKPQEH